MRYLLKAHYLFDGEKKIRDGAVLTSDGQIEAAGSRSEIGDVDDAIVYDFGDATLMPGLIDCHDHLTSGLLEFGQNRYVSTSWAILKAANDLKLTLERGFTTVRDCGGLDLGVKKAVQAGLIPGPRLVISLVIVTQSAGLADYYIPGLDTYIPVPKMPGIPDGVANGVDQVRAKAREIIRAGADRSRAYGDRLFVAGDGQLNVHGYHHEGLSAVNGDIPCYCFVGSGHFPPC